MSSPIDRIRPAAADRHTVGEVATRFGLSLVGSADVEIWSVALDDRAVGDGDLFVALPGARTHGAVHAPTAVARGARAVLTDPVGASRLEDAGVPVLVTPDPRGIAGAVAAHVYGNPSERLTTFAVTGTNGKTTTTYFLEHILRTLGWRTGLVGTVEIRSGDTVLPSRLTTPEAVDLQAMLAAMRDDGVQTLSMEVSSHALMLHRVDGLVFGVSGFTNLSQDHLDFHGDLESYFTAKASLFTPARTRRGVVLVDEEWGRRLAAQAQVPVATVATRSGVAADWRVTALEAAPEGTRLTLTHVDGRELTTSIAMPGLFNVANAALALAMVLEAGTDVRDLAEALVDGLRPVVPGRMERVPAAPGPRPTVLVDFAHNPDALALALAAVRETTPGRVTVVFGATGERDRGKRPSMGSVAVAGADVVVVTDDDPHDEDPAPIREQILVGARAAREAEAARGRLVEVREIAPRSEAIRSAIAAARPGDTVLVAGRGHETIQEVAGVDLPLDDRVEARAALDAWTPDAETTTKEHHA